MNSEPWGNGYRGATDKLYTLRIDDISLSNWDEKKISPTKRLVLQTDFFNDPSLYHINDPSLVDLRNGHYRIYFEMECINNLNKFGEDPRKCSAGCVSETIVAKLACLYNNGIEPVPIIRSS